jgi:hypothetical protein
MRFAALALIGCLGGRTPAEPAAPPKAQEAPPMQCTARLSPGDDVNAAIADGAILCLAPGDYDGPLEIAQSVTIVGEPGAVIRAQGRGPAVRVLAHQLKIVLRGLTLTDGYAEAGSGVYVDGYSELLLDGCTIRDNREGTGGATGLYVGLGHVTARGTTFGPADALVATQIGKLTLEASTVQGDLAILDGAEVRAEGGAIRGNVTIRGTTSRAPKVTFASVDAPHLHNDPDLPGELTLK